VTTGVFPYAKLYDGYMLTNFGVLVVDPDVPMFSRGGGGCEAAVMPEAHCRKKKALSPLGGDDRGLLYFLGFTAAEAVAFARHGRDGEDFAAAF